METTKENNRQLLHALPTAVYTCDKDGYINMYNKAAVELWGCEPELGKDRFDGAWKIYHSGGALMQLDECPTATVLKGGHIIPGKEIIIQRPDGTKRFVLPHPTPIVDASGALTGAINMLIDITDYKITEQALRESESNLNIVVEAAEFGIWEFIFKTREIIYSSQYLQIIGFDEAAKPTNEELLNLIHPDDRHIRKEAVARAFRTGNLDLEVRIIRSDKTIRWIKSKGKVFYDEQMIPQKMRGVIMDITEQKAAFNALEESEDRFKTIANTAPVMIWMSGNDKFSDFFNTSWLDFTGRTIEQESGEGWLENVHPDDVKRCIETYQNSFKAQKAFYIEYRIRRHDGKYRWISDNAVPRFDDDGKFIGFISACRDIDEEKRFNEKLQESELLFKTITNVSPVGLWMTDEEGHNNFVNDTWIEWSGIPQEEQYNRGWMEVVLPADKEYILKKFRQDFAARQNFSAEFRIKRKDGQVRWVLSEGSPYTDLDGNFAGYAGSVSDITERKQDEMRKNEFFAVASHELKTPLTSIKAYAQLLANTYEKTNDVFLKNALGKMEKQVNKMTKLVGDFLNLAKIESNQLQLNKETFAINDLVTEVAADMQLVSIHHKIVVEKANMVKVKADNEKIAQVIANFLTNAVKYSPEDKNITITVGKENGHAKVSVLDKGIGIKQEEQEKIFERFYRSKFNNNISFSGFGIGLYISAEIIHRHNGKIGVSSNEDGGATFYFTLPVA